MLEHHVGLPIPSGCVDTLELDPTGLVRVLGWCTAADVPALDLKVNGAPTEPVARYRTYRPDVAADLGPAHAFHGFGVDWLARDASREIRVIELLFESRLTTHLEPRLRIHVPPYDDLFTLEEVLNRNGIYGSGPPVDAVADDVLALARNLPDPLLDFGCGKGALLRRLAAMGKKVRGIEVDRPAIRHSLAADLQGCLDLYDGALPLPYEAEEFASASCVEVLEHCDRPEAVVAELSRVVRDRCLFSVPDLTAVPICSQHRVVPWHLLESTHVNFFTPRSLERLLLRSFSKVALARIGADAVGGTRFWTSVAAICFK